MKLRQKTHLLSETPKLGNIIYGHSPEKIWQTPIMKFRQIVVIFEKGENNYGAYAPDLPGCGVVGETLEEVRTLIAEAIEFHIEGLRESGEVVPQPAFTPPVQNPPGVSSELIAVWI